MNGQKAPPSSTAGFPDLLVLLGVLDSECVSSRARPHVAESLVCLAFTNSDAAVQEQNCGENERVPLRQLQRKCPSGRVRAGVLDRGGGRWLSDLDTVFWVRLFTPTEQFSHIEIKALRIAC